jgi:uncharacterized integral membrane protein
MKRIVSLLIGTTALLLLCCLVLFVLQNSARTTQLSLDLGLYAFKLKQPVPITVLMGIVFGAGTLFGAIPMTRWAFRQRSSAKALEQQLQASESHQDWP